jgi:TolB-like protein
MPIVMKHIHLKMLYLISFLSVLCLLPFFSPPLNAAVERVVIFPVNIYGDPSKAYLRQGFTSMFVSRLSGGDLEVIGEGRYWDLLSEKEKEGSISRERVEELARRLKADYAVFGSVTTLGEGYSLDFSILDLGKEKNGLTHVSETAQEDQLIPMTADVAHQFRAIIEGVPLPPRRRAGLASLSSSTPESEPAESLFVKADNPASRLRPSGEVSIRLAVMSFDLGDLDGDGQVEWAILGKEELLIYKKEKGAMVLKGRLGVAMGEEFLKVSVGDVDGDGKAEIYLASLYGLIVRTSVWTWSEKFETLFREQGNMRLLNRPDSKKPLLLFQNSVMRHPFKGTISLMNYDGDHKLHRQEALEGLKDAQFYTLAVLDMDGDGQMEFIGLNGDSRLQVWDRTGKTLWSGDEALGGTNNAIGEGIDPYAWEQPLNRLPLNSRLIIMDVDGDGVKEVLAVKNIPTLPVVGKYIKNLKLYDKGQLNAYKIKGTTLVPAWTSKEIDRSISDIQTYGKTLFLAKNKVTVNNFSKGTGGIAWFE